MNFMDSQREESFRESERPFEKKGEGIYGESSYSNEAFFHQYSQSRNSQEGVNQSNY